MTQPNDTNAVQARVKELREENCALRDALAILLEIRTLTATRDKYIDLIDRWCRDNAHRFPELDRVSQFAARTSSIADKE